MKLRFVARLQAALVIVALAFTSAAFAAKGAPGGGGGGKAALVFPSANSMSVPSEILLNGLSVSATSGNAQPTITLTSSTFPEIAVANVTNIPAGKTGPLFTTTLQLAPWIPTRAEIGTGTVVFVASDGVTSITYALTITVQDAPETITGLTASSDGSQITASWVLPALGGTVAIAYFVQACYRIEIRTGFFAAQCNALGTTPNTSAVFPANTTDPAGGAYFEILVTPVDSLGVSGPMTQFLMP